jgi:hypothetical protein
VIDRATTHSFVQRRYARRAWRCAFSARLAICALAVVRRRCSRASARQRHAAANTQYRTDTRLSITIRHLFRCCFRRSYDDDRCAAPLSRWRSPTTHKNCRCCSTFSVRAARHRPTTLATPNTLVFQNFISTSPDHYCTTDNN